MFSLETDGYEKSIYKIKNKASKTQLSHLMSEFI